MYIPLWLIAIMGAGAVVVVGFTILALKRSLHELMFWRGAYCYTSDRACELLAEVSSTLSESIMDGTIDADRMPVAVLGRERLERLRGASGNGQPMAADVIREKSVQDRYLDVVRSVRDHAAALRISWLTDGDKHYYQSQRDGRIPLEPPCRRDATPR